MLTASKAKTYLTCMGAVACLGLGAVTAPAHAQGYYDQGYYDSEGVTVYAPRHHLPQYNPMTGAPIETISTSRRVYLGDLNLRTGWGMHRARLRIERAASDACDDLDRNNTVTQDITDQQCFRNAVGDAWYRVNRLMRVNYER